MDPVGALSAWVTLNQVTANNGCLHFVPGSHKFGCLEAIALKVDGGSIVQKMTNRGYRLPGPVAVGGPAGGVTFHHGYISLCRPQPNP